jgi:glycosyl transferase family 1
LADQQLHIVCFDVPWPPDYGGAIDMMSRIESLHRLGVKIHLHYFSYNERGKPPELEKYCEQIKVYERKTGWKGFSFSMPYIVRSRINDELIRELQKDNFPLLLEGLHCTGVLTYLGQDRKIVVRMHNDEAIYYKELANYSSDLLKKTYYAFESKLLEKYSRHLSQHCTYACISKIDATRLNQNTVLKNAIFLPAFPNIQSVTCQEGVGNFCLYHGNLGVVENEKAATWLIEKVFNQMNYPFVIAGKNPSPRLRKLVEKFNHGKLESNPTQTRMNELISNAQINVLPLLSKLSTGIRLKLLHALFQGRHCVATPQMVEGTGLEAACHIGKNETAFASVISQLFHSPFTDEEISLRKKLLESDYNNEKNARRLIEWLFKKI